MGDEVNKRQVLEVVDVDERDLLRQIKREPEDIGIFTFGCACGSFLAFPFTRTDVDVYYKITRGDGGVRYDQLTELVKSWIGVERLEVFSTTHKNHDFGVMKLAIVYPGSSILNITCCIVRLKNWKKKERLRKKDVRSEATPGNRGKVCQQRRNTSADEV